MSTNEIDVAGIRARAEGARVAADSAGAMAAMTKDVDGVFKVVATAAARSAADVPALLDALAAAEAQLADRDRVIAAVRELAFSEDSQAVLFGVTGTHPGSYGGVTKDEALECAGELLTELRAALDTPAPTKGRVFPTALPPRIEFRNEEQG